MKLLRQQSNRKNKINRYKRLIFKNLDGNSSDQNNNQNPFSDYLKQSDKENSNISSLVTRNDELVVRNEILLEYGQNEQVDKESILNKIWYFLIAFLIMQRLIRSF